MMDSANRGAAMEPVPSAYFSRRMTDAFEYARALHAKQVRKGTTVPYIGHLLAVTALVIEHGGDEDQAVAALLHDAIEDQGPGGRTRDEIEAKFAGAWSGSSMDAPTPTRFPSNHGGRLSRGSNVEVPRVRVARFASGAREVLLDDAPGIHSGIPRRGRHARCVHRADPQLR